jgi:hypothetical protein
MGILTYLQIVILLPFLLLSAGTANVTVTVTVTVKWQW